MIVYSSNKAGFIDDVFSNQIADIIEGEFQANLGRSVGQSEKRSWANSLQYMERVLNRSSIPDDCGIFVECQLPQSGKRIDFIITGKDGDEKDQLAIVELKQWESATMTNMDAIVRTRFQHGEKETQHPSYQAWSYAAFLKDYNEVVYTENVSLLPCAYLHNYREDDVIRNPFYAEHLEKAPVFLKSDALKLREFLESYFKHGDQGELMYRIERGAIRPSKMLADALQRMLEGNTEFTLIDEQKVVFEKAMDLIESEWSNKQIYIVEGGPGTGKTVVAINLLVAAHYKALKTAAYVTKNAAPRAVYESKLTGLLTKSRFSNLFKGSGAFVEAREDVFDALIIDETHRLNQKSGLYGNLGENQIKELIHASKKCIFFIDEDQRVTLKDIGTRQEVEKWAYHFRADVKYDELPSQFRCNGSDGYLSWLDATLQLRDSEGEIRSTANMNLQDVDYDFRVFDNVSEMDKAVRLRNEENNKSRLVAGYCWDWVSKKDPEAYDISFPQFGFKRKWNLSEDGSLWILKPNSIEEIGCIHTCQGLELDYVGVIIGDDLKLDENGFIEVDPSAHPTRDRALFGWKKMMRENPNETAKLLDMIIKNTYRTLMTRGMKGCYVYCTDSRLRKYLRDTSTPQVRIQKHPS